MKPTQELVEEHEAIKIMLKILESVSLKLEACEKVSPEHLDSMVDFIRIFADKCHHGKEEDLLFPAMVAAGIPREGGPVGVMLREHNTGRSYVKDLAAGIADYKSGNPEAAAKIVTNARAYVALLSQHIFKEDNVLYPMADQRLSAKQQSELELGFEKVEREVIGAGKHQELHRTLEQLQSFYLR